MNSKNMIMKVSVYASPKVMMMKRVIIAWSSNRMWTKTLMVLNMTP